MALEQQRLQRVSSNADDDGRSIRHCCPCQSLEILTDNSMTHAVLERCKKAARRVSCTETHSPWEWAGGEPSWPPAWPEQLGPDGRKSGCPQLTQAGVGLSRNATAHEGPAGHPAPVTLVRLRTRRAPRAPLARPGPGGARSRPPGGGQQRIQVMINWLIGADQAANRS